MNYYIYPYLRHSVPSLTWLLLTMKPLCITKWKVLLSVAILTHNFLDKADVGSMSQCEMLYRTNLLAMVAGGSFPKYADNTVLVYDDISKQFVLELVFKVPVKAVRLRRDKLVFLLLFVTIWYFYRFKRCANPILQNRSVFRNYNYVTPCNTNFLFVELSSQHYTKYAYFLFRRRLNICSLLKLV